MVHNYPLAIWMASLHGIHSKHVIGADNAGQFTSVHVIIEQSSLMCQTVTHCKQVFCCTTYSKLCVSLKNNVFLPVAATYLVLFTATCVIISPIHSLQDQCLHMKHLLYRDGLLVSVFIDISTLSVEPMMCY